MPSIAVPSFNKRISLGLFIAIKIESGSDERLGIIISARVGGFLRDISIVGNDGLIVQNRRIFPDTRKR